MKEELPAVLATALRLLDSEPDGTYRFREGSQLELQSALDEVASTSALKRNATELAYLAYQLEEECGSRQAADVLIELLATNWNALPAAGLDVPTDFVRARPARTARRGSNSDWPLGGTEDEETRTV